ncbi:MAG: hypothetical protein WD469_11060 [Paenibacillaceae bacterium]
MLVTDSFLNKSKMVLGNEFFASTSETKVRKIVTVHVKLVGVIDQKDQQDLYWNHCRFNQSEVLFIPEWYDMDVDQQYTRCVV